MFSVLNTFYIDQLFLQDFFIKLKINVQKYIPSNGNERIGESSVNQSIKIME